MIYIFEDSDKSPISVLLKYVLGDSVVFSNGALNLRVELEKHPDGICCMDVVPDNDETVEMYNELTEEYGRRIIPIPCIEFATLLMLADLGIKLTCNLTDLYHIISGVEIKKYADKSLEKYLKRLLNSDVKKCLHNAYKKDNSLYGLFYNSDCTCDKVYSSACVKFNRNIKGKTLFKYTTINTTPGSINKLYENICKALGVDIVIKY